MSRWNELSKQILDAIPGGVACGIVDLQTGLLRGSHVIPTHLTRAHIEAVAAVSVDMVRGRTVQRVEQLVARLSGREIQNSIEELFFATKLYFHYLQCLPDTSVLIVVVTDRHANRGLIWAKLKAALDRLPPKIQELNSSPNSTTEYPPAERPPGISTIPARPNEPRAMPSPPALDRPAVTEKPAVAEKSLTDIPAISDTSAISEKSSLADQSPILEKPPVAEKPALPNFWTPPPKPLPDPTDED